MSEAPSPFSPHNPNLQVVWDSTSLKALMACPRAYKYGIVDGWRLGNSEVDLHFGIYFASGVETYKKARLDGKTKDEATLLAVRKVVEDSWIEGDVYDDADGTRHIQEGHPWGGGYEDFWHCLGETKFKNAKGNHAKCPLSHKGHWIPGHGPDTCGICGSQTETVRRYNPINPAKNRHTLVRLIAWYCFEQPEDLEGHLAPVRFPNGKMAVELSAKVPLPYKNKYGEPYVLSSHMDSIMSDGLENFITDNKTTKNTITKNYWAQFNPNAQVATYDLIGNVLWPEMNLNGVAIEAAQTMVEGARFAFNPIHITPGQREEYLQELKFWLDLAEKFAEEDYWPMNRTSCKICPFQQICSKDPAKREMYLKAEYVKRKWNPLEER